MDGFNEKKWFVYLVDHHEGPLSLADVQTKMASGQVSRSTYVWAEGMSDWKPMNEVPAFQTIGQTSIADDGATSLTLISPESEAQSFEMPSLATAEAGPASSPAMAMAFASPSEDSSYPGSAIAVAEATTVAEEASPVLTEAVPTTPEAEEATNSDSDKRDESKQPSNKKRMMIRAAKWLIFLGVPTGLGVAYTQGHLDPLMKSPAFKAGIQAAQDFAQPHLLQLAEKFPAIGQWVSPIQALEDVLPEEYEELKNGATGSLEKNGPKFAVALSRNDLLTPQFYVASNLPDGAAFEIYLEGVADTLLNHLSFSGKDAATLTKKLGKSQPIRFTDGKPLARGEYTVYLIEAEQQPQPVSSVLGMLQASQVKLPPNLPKGRKLITKKVYFLGGAKDATYTARLKEFHDKLKARAIAEMTEVKQFAGLLEGQFASTQADFTRFKKGARPTKAQAKAWTEAHKKWSGPDAQFTESAKKWVPETLEQEYFYGVLYRQTQQAGEAVSRLHGVHHAYFTGKVDAKSFEIQLGEVTSQAQTALTALKSKIEQAEKMPPAPSGVPRRDGL